jgi:hypothetical protein
MLHTPPRRRALRDDIVQKRQALAALLPIHDQIGPWQARTARLIAYAEKLRSTGSYNPAVVAEAEALLAAVSQQQRALDETTASLSPDIAANSRVFDTARALKSIANGLESALAMMQRSG